MCLGIVGLDDGMAKGALPKQAAARVLGKIERTEDLLLRLYRMKHLIINTTLIIIII